MTHLEPLTVQLEPDKRQAIDRIATETHRDRDDILNEAIAAYLENYDWQISHITEGLRQANEGEFASEEEVAAAFAKWRK